MSRLASLALADKSQRWWHLSCIQLAGGLISIPVITMGSDGIVGQSIASGILSIFIGNAIVLVIGYLMITMAFHSRMNAVENTTYYLGKFAGETMALLILMSAIGWVAWELSSGVKLLKMHPSFDFVAVGPLIGACASLILLSGIKGLKHLCVIATLPLLIFFFVLAYLGFQSEITPSVPAGNSHFFLDIKSIALISAASLGASIDYPTFFRHGKTLRDCYIAIGVIFVATSLVQIIGIFCMKSILDGQDGAVAALLQHGGINEVSFVAFLLISMLGSLAWNIYAASVGWESLFPMFKDRTEYAMIGLIATILFMVTPLQNLFMVVLADLADTIICAFAGSIIFNYLFVKRPADAFLSAPVFNRLFEGRLHPHTPFLSFVSLFSASLVGVLNYFNLIFFKDISILVAMFSGFIFHAVIWGASNLFRRLNK